MFTSGSFRVAETPFAQVSLTGMFKKFPAFRNSRIVWLYFVKETVAEQLASFSEMTGVTFFSDVLKRPRKLEMSDKLVD